MFFVILIHFLIWSEAMLSLSSRIATLQGLFTAYFQVEGWMVPDPIRAGDCSNNITRTFIVKASITFHSDSFVQVFKPKRIKILTLD